MRKELQITPGNYSVPFSKIYNNIKEISEGAKDIYRASQGGAMPVPPLKRLSLLDKFKVMLAKPNRLGI